MQNLRDLLRNARIQKGFTSREVSKKLGIDAALISKFESGSRRPTRDQVLALCELLGLSESETLLAWLAEKILSEIEGETLGLQALMVAQASLKADPANLEVESQFEKLLKEMESLKQMLGKNPG